MTKIFSSLIFLNLFLITSNVYSKEKFELKNGIISVDLPKNWQSSTVLLGIPLTLLGPELAGARPVILFTPSGVKQLKFDSKELDKKQDEYKTEKENWLQKQKGNSLKYFPYKLEQLKNGTEVHQIGFTYKLNDVIFSEYTYFLLCDDYLFHAKVLLRNKHEAQYKIVTDNIMRSFECK